MGSVVPRLLPALNTSIDEYKTFGRFKGNPRHKPVTLNSAAIEESIGEGSWHDLIADLRDGMG